MHVFITKKVRDQLNPTFRFDDKNVNQSMISHRYDKCDKITQTTLEINSLSSSYQDLANNNSASTESVSSSHKSNIKKKLSSIFKSNQSESTSNEQNNETPSSPKTRSLSLKNFNISSNFLPAAFNFNTNKVNSKTSINNNNNENDDIYVNLEDSDLNGLNFNKDNMKLVLNHSDKTN
jgi:hypothetical protein